jgi:hypothetical protein
MKFFRIAILALSQFTGGALLAGQPAIEPPARPADSPSALLPAKAQERKLTNSPAAPEIPAPPPIRSPVDFFRQLLDMSPAQRLQALTNRSETNRKLILAKVREYRSFSENERELRLRATELEWYLVPLMKVPATNRAARLITVPEEYRKMIQARLEDWDQLPESVRKELVDRRESIRVYIQMTSGVPMQTNSIVPRRPAVEEDLKKIQAMSEADRQKLITRFNQYFDLTDHEKQKALRTLTPEDQEQIRKTLSKYENLTASQRAQCIRSFGEFANMTYAERQQFLKNAERWIMMTPDKRRAWREVVEKVSVTPPTFAATPKPPSPPPPGNRRHDLTTNGN